ncbi:hypothetical protein [Acetobacterium wieringae]|nr:hypothetical protein [Acetobacterium wieringae]
MSEQTAWLQPALEELFQRVACTLIDQFTGGQKRRLLKKPVSGS